MAKRRKKRNYTDEEKAAAVAAVAANGGNVKGTADKLGIPPKTLENWLKQTTCPHIANIGEQKKASLAIQLKALAEKLVGIAEKKAESLNAKDAMIAAAVAIDKARLLENEPTVINEQRGSVTHRIEHLASAFAAAAAREEASALPSHDPGKPLDS